jgi:predicted protein tyrosine phosphatase
VQPQILVLSEKRAQAHEPAGREVCISVTGPDKPLPDLSPRFLAVLRLAFTDITEPTGLDTDVLFTHAHAWRIVRFATRWRHVDRIVIHCQAGLSRSPGIAIGLCELFEWGSTSELEEQHPLWNKLVRRELVRTGRAGLP